MSTDTSIPVLDSKKLDELEAMLAADESDDWYVVDHNVVAGPGVSACVYASDGDAVAKPFGNAAHGVDAFRRGLLIAALRNAAPELIDATRRVDAIDSLFAAIAHGDAEHRAWLQTAIAAHFAGESVPPMVEGGERERLRAQLALIGAKSDEWEQFAATRSQEFAKAIKVVDAARRFVSTAPIDEHRSTAPFVAAEMDLRRAVAEFDAKEPA
jgi:hypothetical protein